MPHVRRQNFRLESASYLGLRLPALALLGKSIAQVFAKAAELSTLDSRWLNVARVILPDVSSTPDATIMWSVFLSLAIACLAEAFVRALNNECVHLLTPPIAFVLTTGWCSPRHHPSFNMLSVSYLLHFHSTPASDPFLRPTPVVYLLIGLTLSEVWTLQMIDTFQLQARLAVTAFFSIFGQSTMVYLLYSTTHSNLDPVALNAILPALRHLTRLSELVFFGISLVTIAVHAAAQLAVEHRITSDIFGRAARLPTRNDDFSLAVIVYGAACLETTHASGLSNEVAPLLAKVDMPYIELANGAPTAITDSSSHNSQSIFMADVNYAYPSSQLRGLQTEVTDVRARALHPDQAPNPMSRTSSLVREAGRLCIALSNILLDILRLCCFTLGRRFDFLSKRAKGPGRIARALRFMGVRDEEMPIRFRTRRSRQATPARHVDVVESDSEDEDFVLRADSNSASDSEEDGSEGTDGDQDEDEDEGREDSFVLYTDFMQEEQEGESPEDLNKVMVAHMAGPAHRRLTRAQFQQLAAVPTAPTRPQAPAGSIDTSRWENLETQLVCIVCRADARSIICWPCRCLAMCEGCKDVLATTSHSSNSCPTCRQPVQGYSRIFVA